MDAIQMEKYLLSALMLGANLIASVCIATPANTSQFDVPDDVRAFVTPSDTLLAYKPADFYGDGTEGAVIVVRHPAADESDYDFNTDPCELVILHRKDSKLVVIDRSTKTVDCTCNDVARNARTMSLGDSLTAKLASIVYINQKDKGDSTFYFAWSRERNAWYLQRITATNANGPNVTNASASYPGDFAWTAMSSVDPVAMAKILEATDSDEDKGNKGPTPLQHLPASQNSDGS